MEPHFFDRDENIDINAIDLGIDSKTTGNDYKDADCLYQARYERRQRMLQRVFCLGILGVLVVFLGFALGKSDADETPPQAQKETAAKQGKDETLPQAQKETAAKQGKAEGGEDNIEPETDTSDSFAATPNTVSIRGKKVASTHAILVDESTGTIIASKRAKKKIFPASMTKVLTVLVAAEQITEEELDDKWPC